MRLKDRVTVITGGNSGIGLAIAQEFQKEGARGIISGRNRITLEDAEKSLGENFCRWRAGKSGYLIQFGREMIYTAGHLFRFRSNHEF